MPDNDIHELLLDIMVERAINTVGKNIKSRDDCRDQHYAYRIDSDSFIVRLKMLKWNYIQLARASQSSILRSICSILSVLIGGLVNHSMHYWRS